MQNDNVIESSTFPFKQMFANRLIRSIHWSNSAILTILKLLLQNARGYTNSINFHGIKPSCVPSTSTSDTWSTLLVNVCVSIHQ